MAISKRLRYEILRRDNHSCRYCGASAPDATLTVDHVIPVALGGSDEPSNLVTACHECNSGKSASSPDAAIVQDVAEDALRWRRAMEVANEIAGRDRDTREAFCDAFEEHWGTWTYTIPTYKGGTGKPQPIELPAGWEVTIGRLMADGVTIADIRECVDIAMAARNIRDEYSYFLGVVRQRLRERQAVAAELLRRGLVDGKD